MASSVKCLPLTHEGMSLKPRTQLKGTSNIGEAGTGGSWKLVKFIGSRRNLKIKWRMIEEDTVCTCMCTPRNMYSTCYTHTHEHMHTECIAVTHGSPAEHHLKHCT